MEDVRTQGTIQPEQPTNSKKKWWAFGILGLVLIISMAVTIYIYYNNYVPEECEDFGYTSSEKRAFQECILDLALEENSKHICKRYYEPVSSCLKELTVQGGISPPVLPGDKSIENYLILDDVGNLEYKDSSKRERESLGIEYIEYSASYYLGGGTYYADVNVRIFNNQEDKNAHWNNALEVMESLAYNWTFEERIEDGIKIYEDDDGISEWAKLSIWQGDGYYISVSEPKSEGGLLEAYLTKYAIQ